MPDASPTAESKPVDAKDEDVKMTDVDDSLLLGKGANGGASNDDIDDDVDKPEAKRRGRGQSDKHRKREEERERKAREKEKEREQAKEHKAASNKLAPQQMKQLNRLNKDIQRKEGLVKECEAEIATIENDLREADCPRTRVLGKDRFWNRYYWFERNGMPYAGLPISSTAYAEYANGCIWVQGPDELERAGYIDVAAELQDEYRTRFNMTIPERKTMEEGGISVHDASQWGYICEPDDLDRLIRWLDPRGVNELKLRKELLAYRDKIAMHMDRRKAYLNAGAESSEEGAEEAGAETSKERKERKEEAAATFKRTSSRIRDKTPEAQPPPPPKLRCQQWHNTMALEDPGHLHMEAAPLPPPPPRGKKQAKKREAPSEPTGRETVKARRR